MLIRDENEKDFLQVFELNRRAFESDEEARLVEKLRRTEGAISLVAEIEGRVVGHIVFSRVTLEGEKGNFAGLAPMAVLPEFQRTGVGKQLIKTGIESCAASGFTAIFVLGHSDYYPKFGFRIAAEKGFSTIYPAPEEAFMVLELVPGSLTGKAGLIEYHPCFDEIDE